MSLKVGFVPSRDQGRPVYKMGSIIKFSIHFGIEVMLSLFSEFFIERLVRYLVNRGTNFEFLYDQFTGTFSI